jgi:ribosome biogenesis GTPase / thiamine phosphate phosphatase
LSNSHSPWTPLEGLVLSKQLDRYDVRTDLGVMRCTLAGVLRRKTVPARGSGAMPESTVAVGDRVLLHPLEDRSGVIREVRPRRNRLARRAAGPVPCPQVVAANCDQMVAVFAAAEPRPKWALLDRYLVEAEAAGIPPLICITKCDLVEPAEIEAEMERYRSIGYQVVFTAVATDAAEGTGPGQDGSLSPPGGTPVRTQGIDRLQELLRGRISVLLGKSGVGKSTLVNALVPPPAPSAPDAVRLTAAVSRKTGKGRHTTSEVEMIPLPFGGGLIDTPGMREFALWEIPAGEVSEHFPEMRGLPRSCRFAADCTHSHEPGCAVKAAVRDGRIHPERYRSYLRITGRRPEGGDAGDETGEDRGAHGIKNEGPGDARPAGFLCGHCGQEVTASAPGTEHRNHCPQCLWSRHLDLKPGDRAAACGGTMEPFAVSVRGGGEWALLHRCRECGTIKANRIAGDDNELALLSLAARPMASPPFPLSRLGMRGEG